MENELHGTATNATVMAKVKTRARVSYWSLGLKIAQLIFVNVLAQSKYH